MRSSIKLCKLWLVCPDKHWCIHGNYHWSEEGGIYIRSIIHKSNRYKVSFHSVNEVLEWCRKGGCSHGGTGCIDMDTSIEELEKLDMTITLGTTDAEIGEPGDQTPKEEVGR